MISQAQHFYRVWPYLPRMEHEVAFLCGKSKMLGYLTQGPLFLTANGFQKASDIYLPIYQLEGLTANYLSKSLHLALIPHQITADLYDSKKKCNFLTSSILRDKFKDSVRGHCEALKDKLDVLSSLFIYATNDIVSCKNLSERKMLSISLAGKNKSTFLYATVLHVFEFL